MISNVLNFPQSEDVLQMTDRVMQQAYVDSERPFHVAGCPCNWCQDARFQAYWLETNHANA